MYTVLKDFSDLQDNSHVYLAGDSFPRNGIELSEERIIELSTTANKRGVPLIAVDTAKISPQNDETIEADKLPEKPKKRAKKANKKEQ